MNSNRINYKYVFNKIFTGTYLEHHLGHEIINFIKTDDNKRYIYVNSGGECPDQARKHSEYVLHIMGVKYNNENYYELIAVSEIDKEAKIIYNKDKTKEMEHREEIKYSNHSTCDIFDHKYPSHLYTFVAKDFYKPKKGYRILFKENQKPNIKFDDNNVMIINISCNPQRSRCYSKDEDIEILDKLISGYLERNNEDILKNIYDDEQCFAVISDRTNLEDSTSNQIAYFLNRDPNLANKVIRTLLKVKIDKDENFEILREEHNIDLLLESEKTVIVIENKIDSGINGDQLKKYYNVINTKYKKKNKFFFILEPQYSSITEEIKNKKSCGNKYTIVYYNELFEILSNTKYRPYKKEASEEGKFLYMQFIKCLKYIKNTKAQQKQDIAYIRLKQKLKELENY